MSITQIPFEKQPVPPPPKPEPEQLGLYDTHDWEAAYRELDARVPHLLVQLQDDLARSRRREAAWISIVVHLVLVICLLLPQIAGLFGFHHLFVVPVSPTQDKNVTFLPLPPDLQKPARKPNTNVMSDKDRIAMTRHPELDPKELQKILATPPPGAPGMRAPRSAQPVAPQPPAISQNQAPIQQQPEQGQQATQRPQFESNQTAQLQTPARPANSFKKYMNGMTAGSAIQQAAQAAAATRGAGGGDGGDFGLGTGARGRQYGALDILSDTQGVDFGPYLQRVLQEVRDHWYDLIPESVEMKKGKLALEFAIMKDGHVQGLRITATSGDPALDRPAYGSITGSDPFSPLPPEFKGPYLALRFRFYYNPDKTEIQ